MLAKISDRDFIVPRAVNWLGSISIAKLVTLSGFLIVGITYTIVFLKSSTGVLGSFAPFYLIPIALVAMRANRAASFITALLCSSVWALLDLRFGEGRGWWPAGWDVIVRAGIFVVFALVLSRIKYDVLRESQLNAELQAALAEVKQLSGLLPICAWCKRIRDEDGSWEPIESYISVHSEADFTHGICPDCARKYHPTASK